MVPKKGGPAVVWQYLGYKVLCRKNLGVVVTTNVFNHLKKNHPLLYMVKRDFAW